MGGGWKEEEESENWPRKMGQCQPAKASVEDQTRLVFINQARGTCGDFQKECAGRVARESELNTGESRKQAAWPPCPVR